MGVRIGAPFLIKKTKNFAGLRHSSRRPVYCPVEKLMHQRPNPFHFFFQREMARVEKMELCTGNISFIEFSTLHRKDSIVFAPRNQRRGRMFTTLRLPLVENIQISLRVV